MKKGKCHPNKIRGGVLILLGLLGLFLHAFPGLLLFSSVLVMVAGILALP